MTQDEKNEILKMIKQAKDELRREFWGDSDNALSHYTENKNSIGITFVALSEDGTIDDVTAGEHADLFAEWQPNVAYAVGNIRRKGWKLYKCIQPHNSQVGWEPEVAVSLWVSIADPAEEYQQWSQPISAGDAYQSGDKVSDGGKHWESDVNNNVWKPGVYGWHEVTA